MSVIRKKVIAYIDAFSGVAGDMLMAALIDAGASILELTEILKTMDAIKLQFDISVTSVVRSEGRIAGKHVNVTSVFNHQPTAAPGTINKSNQNFDHSHSHQHQNDSHDHNHDHIHEDTGVDDHNHEHNHTHLHEHLHDHGDDDGHHHNRGLSAIKEIIMSSALPESVKATSILAFTELAWAESHVHGSSIEDVHFHEVHTYIRNEIRFILD